MTYIIIITILIARGYVTSQSQAIVSPSCVPSVPPGCSLTDGYDFNPQLLGGTRGAAGIKARLNQRGVTGNLAGQINILIPIALFGIIQVNVHQVSITVALTLNRGPTGSIFLQLSVGYVDVYIEMEDLSAILPTGMISSRVRNMLPTQVCNQIPTIVNDQLNSKLGIIPQSIPLSQLLQTALSAFGLDNLLGGEAVGQCPSSCASKKAAAAPKGPKTALAPPQSRPPQPSGQSSVDKAAGELEPLKTPQAVKPERQPQALVQLVDTPRLVLAPQQLLNLDSSNGSRSFHRTRGGFLTVRIGPETPKIGELLKTTVRQKKEIMEVLKIMVSRNKRQDNSLTDLGICFGDILPAVRERYPNQRIVVVIRTARAPSVVLSARNGGTASLDFVIDADFYIESTNQKVKISKFIVLFKANSCRDYPGAAVVDFTVNTEGGRLSARADISRLQLRDVGNSLGLPQDALDNLGTLGKEVILKAGNDALAKGTSLSLPPGVGVCRSISSTLKYTS
uniref:Lipid-binding serum glycoprotein C-terminal domain-containing protein n=1 Tax=Ditylenchus dipsaci TaxID=166011 RepID=A0A915EHU6_9BILA